MKELITHKELKKELRYFPDSGEFWWKKSAPGRRHGVPAGTKNRGYRVVTIHSKTYAAHRLAWFYMMGSWPECEIDHENGNGLDNRWCNIRQANKAENAWNSKRYSSNTSGYKGVHWDKQRGKWHSRITKNGKIHYLGHYDCPKEAHKVYCKKADELHGEYANHG